MTISEPDAQEIVGMLAQMPPAAKLVFLDQHGDPQPVTTAFDAMSVVYPVNSGQCPWLNIPALGNDPARIIFSSTLPKDSPYYTSPQQPDGFTVGQMVIALGSPAPLASDGLFSTMNSGDVPTNTGSPISYVEPPVGDGLPVIIDVHGVYVDFQKSRVLLTPF
jgi:hypothetical protein